MNQWLGQIGLCPFVLTQKDQKVKTCTASALEADLTC